MLTIEIAMLESNPPVVVEVVVIVSVVVTIKNLNKPSKTIIEVIEKNGRVYIRDSRVKSIQSR